MASCDTSHSFNHTQEGIQSYLGQGLWNYSVKTYHETAKWLTISKVALTAQL